MKNDLVQRLEKCAETFGQSNSLWWQNEANELLEEAAKEIKRLREFSIDLLRADEIEATYEEYGNEI